METPIGASPVVEMRGIIKSYSGVQVLKGVDFELNNGEFHGLVGENGAGKSTLIKILGGATAADSGEILIDGKPVTMTSPADAQLHGISIVHQHASLVQDLSISENLFLGQEIGKGQLGFVDWEKQEARAKKVCGEVGLDCDVTRPVKRLSFVEQQLVSIAKALIAPDMRAIILDEPTAAMDQSAKERLFEVLQRLKEKGISAIYISHRLDEVFEVTDRITILRDGSKVGTVRTKDTTTNEVVRMMLGRTLEQQFPTRISKIGEPVLAVHNLTRRPFFTDVSFQLRQGEILGIFGAVGSGKTELLRCIYGADSYEEGSITLGIGSFQASSPHEAIRKGVFLVPEDRRDQGLIPAMDIKDNALLANPRRSVWMGVFKDHKAEQQDAETLARNLGIRSLGLNQAVRSLSGGNQQKVVVAKGLYTESEIYMFDEPTKGVDVGAKAEIYRLIGEMVAKGASVILASSELPEIMGMCDRIVVMRNQGIVAILNREEATEERVLALALAGNAKTRQ